MALHNTQCPHCFTTYVISDEQLRVSEGMVRCGTCRERFQARLLDLKSETPRFDPREAFIEPISEEMGAQKEAADKLIADTEPQEYSFADPHTESEKSDSLSEATVSGSINSDLSLDIDENAPVTPVDSSQLSAEQMLANIRAKQAREVEISKTQEAQKASLNNDTITPEPNTINNQSPTAEQQAMQRAKTEQASLIRGQQELALPVSKKQVDSNSVNSSIQGNASASSSSKETLIDEVDSLVDNKLVNTTASAAAKKAIKPSEQPFRLDRKPAKKSRAWLVAPPLLTIVALLGCILIYQLWMKQIVVFKEKSFAQKKIVELSKPIAKKLAEHDIVLPLRRNLSQLELASARTETHPTRPSTTLLRISIINHAEIEQPLPWLEMSLTDADGRLVSRRSLSPSDYVYQNATDDLIGARELKKVTIELLSFPKQATGYELKILNK